MRDKNSWKQKLCRKLECENEKSFKSATLTASEFVDIELALTLSIDLFSNQPAQDFWSILTGYQFHIPGYKAMSYEDKRKIAVARFYLINYKTRSNWYDYLDKYRNFKKSLRAFRFDTSIEEDKYYIRKREPSFLSERYLIYQQVLSKPPKHKKNKTIWFTDQEGYIIDGERKLRFQVPEDFFVDNNPEKLKLNKKDHYNPTWRDLLNTAKWIDEKRSETEKPWRLKRLEKIQFKVRKNRDNFKEIKEDETLKLESIYNIIGMLGSGKTLLIDVLIVWAARNDIHTTLILENVPSILNKVDFFSDLGINACPIIGASNREKHAKKILMINDVSDLEAGEIEDINSIKWVDSFCALEGFINMEGSLERRPCRSLYSKKGKKRKYCPFYFKCSISKISKELSRSNVWIATPYSMVYTRVPEQIMDKKMLFYEAIYLRSNFVIFDESDLNQNILDDIFAPYTKLIDKKQDSWLHKLASQVTEFNISGGTFSEDERINKWIDNYQNALKSIRFIHNMIAKNKEIFTWIDDDFLTSGRLMQKIVLENNDKLKDKEINKLEEALDKPLQQEKLSVFAERLMAGDKTFTDEHDLTYFFKEFNLIQDDSKLLYNKVKLLLLIRLLEVSLKYILFNWSIAVDKIGINVEQVSYFHRILNDYTPIIRENPLANIFGFRYLKEGVSAPLLYTYVFKGFGRDLILNYDKAYYYSDGTLGPSVILFSGSSWLPESTKSHLNIKVNAILEKSPEEISEINKTSFHFIDTGVSVSGSIGSKRLQNLNNVVNELIKDANDTNNISLLRKAFDKIDNKTRKRLLFLVGSYKEVDSVGEYLKNNLDKKFWGEKGYCRMIKDDEPVDEFSLNRSRIDQFYKKEAKILIAPLKAINRGHNILNSKGQSALGAAFFLIRPMPIPTNFSNQIAYINHWALDLIENIKGQKVEDSMADYFIKKLRTKSIIEWKKLNQKFIKYGGIHSYDEKTLFNVYANQFVLIWQAIGRLLRGNSHAQIYFCDQKMNSSFSEGVDPIRNSMLVGFYCLLKKYFISEDNYRRQIVEALYTPVYEALQKQMKELGYDD